MFLNFVQYLCKSTQKTIYLWLVFIAFTCLIASFFLVDLRLDSNIRRLLPADSPLSQAMRQLRAPLGDGGYFTILVESKEREKLVQAAKYIQKEAAKLPDVYFSNCRNPIEFFKKNKYLLLPLPSLERLYDYALRLEAESNPFSVDLMTDQTGSNRIEKSRRRSLTVRLENFSSLTKYHESGDGTLIGILIYPKSLITELDEIRKLHTRLEEISSDAAAKYNVWSQVGGSQIKNLREYKSIVEDLSRAGVISLTAIMLILFFCFRSVRIIPVVVLPLFVGMAWAFAFVPGVIGPLNIITVFLLLILFGMGIDYSIHLIRDFQIQLQTRTLADALCQTYSTTGKSVIKSGLTTAFPLLILALSRFRGFSDFGMIGGWTILLLLVSMYAVLPPLLIIAHRFGLIAASVSLSGSIRPPGRKIVAVILIFIVVSAALSFSSGKLFDYNFSASSSDMKAAKLFKDRHSRVFNHSMIPGALYLAPNISTLDESLAALTTAMEKKGSTIKRLTSIRDFAPQEQEFKKRLELIKQAKEVFKGTWYKNIKDAQVKKWVEDFRLWQPPNTPPALDNLPPSLLSYYLARDGSGQFLLGVFPAVSRRNGHDVLAFYEELKKIVLPDQLQGPVGAVVIFAEILDLVLSETPIVLFFSLLVVALPIYVSSRSFKETWLTLFPLIFGMLLLFGLMGIFGMQLNYLSLVIIPTLLGMGVDDGIHYFNHCKAHNFNASKTQKELFGTLTICTLTTMIGYFGLVVASNKGLRSLGLLACLGMICLWFTSVFLLPVIIGKQSESRES